MSEDKLQAAIEAAKDKAAKEFGYKRGYEKDSWQFNTAEHKHISDRAMQLYAAQCVKDERERISKEREALRHLLREITMRSNICFPENEEDMKWFDETFSGDPHQADFLQRLFTALQLGKVDEESQLIERGEG